MIPASSQFDSANAILVKVPVFLITIDGFGSFTNRDTGFGADPWIVSIDDLTLNVADLDGGSDLGALAFTLQDRDRVITASFPCFVFEGASVTLKTGFPGMELADYITLWTGTIDTVDSVNFNADYYFTCTDKKQILSKSIFTVADDGKSPVDSTHPRTFTGHPLDMLISILENEFGMIRSVDYDYDKIVSYRDGLFSGAQFTFSITSSPTAKDFIEKEILVPLGGYLWMNYAGVITVNFFYPATTTPVFSLTPSNTVDVPEASQSDLVNSITFKFDDDPNGKFLSEATVNNAASINKYGQFGARIIESQGMRSGLQGFFLARQTANLIFARYASKNLSFGQGSAGQAIVAFWTAVKAEHGDFVTVTHPLVPDRAAGVMGISGKVFEVLSKVIHFESCTVELTLIDASYFSGTTSSLITPDSEADYASASSGDKARYMFMCDTHARYTNGDAAKVLG